MLESSSLAPWRSPLSRALHRNRSQPHHRFFQLATVTPAGTPANRTVVFRGFIENSNSCKIITDLRSEKITELQGCSQGEIAWYFVKTREQFRLSGEIILVTGKDLDSPYFLERKYTWQQLSDNARLQFLWAHPGQIRGDNPEDFSPPPPNAEEPVDNFVLLIFSPHRVDHLELRGNPQNRWLYHWQPKSQTWAKTEVNP